MNIHFLEEFEMFFIHESSIGDEYDGIIHLPLIANHSDVSNDFMKIIS
ncbi:Uncharacterised protein [Segatella copri]|nr:Uncharacterised protein [Segatella copri]